MRIVGLLLAAISVLAAIAAVVFITLAIWSTGEVANNLGETGVLAFFVAFLTGLASVPFLIEDF